MAEAALNPFIAIGATLLGFVLATGSDLFRDRRDRNRRQQAALSNLSRELEGNRRSCSSNLMLLKTEAKDLAGGQSKGYVNSLDRLEVGAWPLVRLDMSLSLLADADLLGRIETLLAITRRVNASIDSREQFHIQHLAGDPQFLVGGLAKYAGVLVYPQEDLIIRIDEVQRDLALL
jgi:hypothetical protein